MQNASKLEIDLNMKNNLGETAFHIACNFGKVKIVDMMIEWSESLELDLKAKNNNNQTGYQLAIQRGKTDVVNLIQTKMQNLAL